MHPTTLALIFFFYGLSFFSMGLVTAQEVGRCANTRLRQALYFLAAFGLLHGAHEWLEMLQILGVLPGAQESPHAWENVRLLLLAISFLPLATFGAALLMPGDRHLRLAFLITLILAGVWSFGLLILTAYFTLETGLRDVIDVWTRYIIAIPGALLACVGLIFQQRAFRRSGLARFGRDSLWASIAFAWYGLIGQLFTRPSPLPPSNILNSTLFFEVFGFPVQLLRAGAALAAAVFVIRFLRSFEVETQRRIAELQAARLEEAQRREALRGELLRRVVAAQEAERQRVARDLHDEIGQSLTALGLGLRAAILSLPQDVGKAVQRLRQLEQMTAESLEELQRLISDLRPSHLDDLGLPAALRWYCSELQNRSGLLINLETSGEARDIPAQIKIALFRVAQEALTNVIKHSGATTAWVRLQYYTDVVKLDVEDNGCGFDPQLLTRAGRAVWGLTGMQERASLLGGRLEVYSEPQRGTHISVMIPYHQIEEVDDEYPAGLGDDHFVVRTGLRMLLEEEPDVEIVGEAGTAREAMEMVDALKPDVVLMDIGLPDLTGIDAAREIKRRNPQVAVVALTIHEDEEYFFRMLEVGASGYVPKRAAPEELLTAIRAAAQGEVYLYPSLAKLLVRDFLMGESQTRSQDALDGLTLREKEVLMYLAEGASNDEIAQKLNISPKTVARHRENIMNKLNLHSRTELVKYAIRKGIIQP